ncbi:MAG TPA: SDR family NAD(P)-dependent oxidoreductase [Clostridiales bacterium]|nr:SDR family NAD(P)-dependent oxidoreductase [Clostridiales bacterium]
MVLKDLVHISNYFGSKPEFVLAGGGNTSYKTAEHLYVKGSGTVLADITEEDFVKMNRKLLGQLWEREYSKDPAEREAQVLEDLMNARERSEYDKRPSLETPLHDILDYKYVVHTHPTLVNGLTCSRDGRQEAEELFGDRAIWIPAANPGYALVLAVRKELERYVAKHGRHPQIILLQNHGIFIGADTVDEIKDIAHYVVKAIEGRIKRRPDLSLAEFDRQRAADISPAIRMLLKGEGNSIVTFICNKEISRLVESEQAFKGVSLALSPDHIVYCKHRPLFVPYRPDMEEQYALLAQRIDEYRQRNNFLPKVVAVEKLGVFAWGHNKKAADITAAVFLDAVKISVYAQSFGGSLFLPQDKIDFINDWEAEAYRAKVSLADTSGKRLDEKVVVVTGSAQGFGKGMAEEMAKEGANVVIADINDKLAQQNARSMCRLYGKGKAMAVKVDVSQEASVRDMIIDTVLAYGGLDVFINNAGVLKAGGLEEMDLKSFEFVTKINYTAYYLCTKYASRPMKIQHRFNKNYYTDIIQINSKSGLAGSNRNFAYAGSKFGGIGLTQSFAMELVEYNIKVNAICPGNYFDGPLWSDPENGLFVQYLKAGKVPGAKTFEDVKRFYEAKVPMGRGCYPVDVARAILYAIEQQYETGQAIPVTGGQQMLK